MSKQDAMTIVEELSQQLNVPMAHVWEVMTRQVWVDVYSDLIGWVIFLLISLFFFCCIAWRVKSKEFSCENEPSDVLLAVSAGVTMILFFVFLGSTAHSYIQAKVNPEFRAVAQITKCFNRKDK